MSDAKESLKLSSPEVSQSTLKVGLPSLVPQPESGSGSEAQSSKKKLHSSSTDKGEESNLGRMESSNLSGTQTSTQSQSGLNQSANTGVSFGNVTLQTRPSVSTANPTRDPRYSREEIGRVTVVIYKDRSVTVNMEGVIEPSVLRGQVQRAILTTYAREYREALRKAIEKSGVVNPAQPEGSAK